MAQDPKTLIWLDMEMTGLEPDRDRIIEIALVLTNEALETIAEAPVITVHQPDLSGNWPGPGPDLDQGPGLL